MTPHRHQKRRRNSVLEALEAARRLSPRASLNDLLVFLYVCENEGLNMRELGYLAEMSDPLVSRTARGLTDSDAPGALAPGLGWLEVRVNPRDRRSRTLHLTTLGAQLRDTLGACIRNARPILPTVESTAAQGVSSAT